MTYICRGHRIQLFFVARIATLARAQVQRSCPVDSAATSRMDPRLSAQRTSKLVLLLLQALPRLFVALLLTRLVLKEG